MPDTDTPQPEFSSIRLDDANPAKTDEKMSLIPNFHETYELTKTNRAWKIHCLIAGLVAAGAWTTWFFIDWFAPHFSWFIWVWGACLMSLTLHYYIFIRPKQYYNLHVAWFTILNTNMMLTWLNTDTSYLWWLIVTLSWGHLLNIHYQLSQNKADKHKYIKMHQVSFALFQVMIFFIWIQTSRSFPWFLIVFLGTGSLYLLHHSLHYHPKNYFRLHTYIYADIQLMLYVIWAATGPAVPWFVFPLAGWGVLLYVHYRLHRNKSVPLLPQTTQDAQEPKPVAGEAATVPVPQQTDTQVQAPTYGSMYPALIGNPSQSAPQPQMPASPYPYLIGQPSVYLVPVQAVPPQQGQQ